MRNSELRIIVAVVLSIGSSGCAAWPRTWGAAPCTIQTKPSIKRQSIAWHLFDVTVVSQIRQAFHFGRIGRRLFGLPVRSLNLKDGRLTQSAFLVDRDPSSLTPEQVRWGPTASGDVAQPPFRITKPKSEGKTPGFFVTDSRGVRYLFKLDPVEDPELLSGAEVVTSKLLYALGYRVPSYEIVEVEPEALRIEGAVTVRNAQGRKQPFDEAFLGRLLEGHVREGAIRVSSSRILDGEVLGPARFKRFRDCTEVRSLKVAYAWLNNIDTKDHNSLLVWDGTQTVGYLIDFGTALGADAGEAGPKNSCAGWFHLFDLKKVSLELMTLGFYHSACEVETPPVSANVGRFAFTVDPDRWEPYAPNLAFEEINEQDAQWMAARLARLSRAQIEAAVAAGRYSDPADAAYLTDALESRRMAIVQEYLEDESKEGRSP
jgi:hypothetical protein